MEKMKCSVCGYVYDPAAGIPEDGIATDTSFERLPKDWVCPLCSASKDVFEKE
ncbi:MAG: rubredoxin [Endomicrobium sp.]|nr:rubredoxin [Endomicrobium sp.]